MRVNVYAEEMTDRIEIIEKEIDGHKFTGLRIYLKLPVSTYKSAVGEKVPVDVDAKTHADEVLQVQGPFIHRPGDDDSSAVTFWGKQDLRVVLRNAIEMLNQHYEQRPRLVPSQSGVPCIELTPKVITALDMAGVKWRGQL